MDRKFKFLGELTEDGFIRHDRDEVRQTLLDLEGAVFQLGGVVTMTAIREETSDGEYVTTGVLMNYNSFAPTVSREPESAGSA